jgi:hypothetical protein
LGRDCIVRVFVSFHDNGVVRWPASDPKAEGKTPNYAKNPHRQGMTSHRRMIGHTQNPKRVGFENNEWVDVF